MSFEHPHKTLSAIDIRATKGRGQNFIISESLARKIVDFASVTPDEHVLEVGPGLGALTEFLIDRSASYLAVEIEPGFCSLLRSRFRHLSEASVVCADFRDVELIKLLKRKAVLVSNVPYVLSSELLLWLFRRRQYFSRASLLFQREFSERVASREGTKQYGSLSVLCHLLCDCVLGDIVSGRSFFPEADVESRLLRLNILEEPRYKVSSIEWFEKVVRAAFSKRRKTVFNALRNAELPLSDEQISRALAEVGVAPEKRAEQLRCEQYAKLSSLLKASTHRQ